jgi:hypothetical protein
VLVAGTTYLLLIFANSSFSTESGIPDYRGMNID